MKQSWLYMLFLFVGIPCIALGQQTLSTMSTDITVRDDGSLLVKEIVTLSADKKQDYWLTRTIPLHFSSDMTTHAKQRMQISNPQASWDGLDLGTEIDETERFFTIKVVNPRLNIDENKKTIELSYLVDGALRYGAQRTQLVWQMVAADDKRMIGQTTASVSVPQEYPLLATNCYVSHEGTQYSCSTSSRIEGARLAYYAHRNIQSDETLTIVADFNQGIEGKELFATLTWWQWLLVVVGSLIGLGLLWIVYLWMRYIYKVFQSNRKSEESDY